MHFMRFDGARIAEHWGVADEFHAFTQLGVPPEGIQRAHQAITGREIRIPDEAVAMVADYESYLS
jgi:hypothetical protein